MVKPVKRRRFGRRKVCKFCVDKIDAVDYRDVKRVRSLKQKDDTITTTVTLQSYKAE